MITIVFLFLFLFTQLVCHSNYIVIINLFFNCSNWILWTCVNFVKLLIIRIYLICIYIYLYIYIYTLIHNIYTIYTLMSVIPFIQWSCIYMYVGMYIDVYMFVYWTPVLHKNWTKVRCRIVVHLCFQWNSYQELL